MALNSKIIYYEKITLLILNVVVIVCCFQSCNLAPGSYPYAEIYKFKSNETGLISAIKEFKKDNPDYCVPPNIGLEEGKSNNRDDHWYHIYFYYRDENQIVYTWVRQTKKETVSFAFVSINNGLTLGNWKDINSYFSRKENKMHKKKFEHLILNEIKKYLGE